MTTVFLIDGSCHPETKKSAWAVVQVKGRTIATFCGKIITSSSTVAEKVAFFVALIKAPEDDDSVIKTDCMAVINCWRSPDHNNPFDMDIQKIKEIKGSQILVIKSERKSVKSAHILAKGMSK